MAKYIPIEELEEGMIIAKDVTNSFGQVMVKSGAKIEKKHIPIFQKWSINGVLIIDESEAEFMTTEILTSVRNKINTKMTWKPESKLEIDMYKSAMLVMARGERD